MNLININIKPNLAKIIGLLLIISALSIWTYSIIELQSNEAILANQKSPIDQVWRAQGALQWWQNFYSTTIIPATTILILSGIATILVPQLNTRVTQRIGFSKFEKELEEALQY